MELDLSRLPSWQAVLEDLPVGVGIKGGTARKILKVCAGIPSHVPHMQAELFDDGDIDLLIAVAEQTAELRAQLRKQFSGRSFGSMVVEPKDIEVSDSLTKYFHNRDVTMNEVLVFRASRTSWLLYYTTDALQDVRDGIIRPSQRCLHTGYALNYQIDPETETEIVAPKPFSRCLIRFLKGHGSLYGIGDTTWHYYQERRRLSPRELFRTLKVFVRDDVAFDRCIRHLKTLKLIDGSVEGNYLWGEAMQATNEALARFGRRLTFAEPTADEIERWIGHKMEEYARWKEERAALCAMGQWVEDDTPATITFPFGESEYPALCA
jgi:hypothetical protein